MRAVVLALRFASEVAALTALAVTGVGVADGIAAVVLAVALPAAAAAAWGRFVAPASPTRLRDPGRAAVEVVIFATAVAGLAATGHPLLATLLAATAAVTAPATRRYEPTRAAST